MGQQRSVTLYLEGAHDRAILRPVADELGRRGYAVRETVDFDEPSALGLYACHPNRYFDFSTGEWRRPPSTRAVLALHDLGQDGGADAGYFVVDGWHTFDLGLLPGPRWNEIWARAEEQGLPGPTEGMHTVGWAKADRLWAQPEAHAADVAQLRASLGLGDRPTLLLACSWSDQRQLEELLSAVDLDRYSVVLRYPEAGPPDPKSPWYARLSAAYEQTLKVQARARQDPRLVVAPDGADIMTVVGLADVIVSNASGVLYDGILAGVPGISVRGWLHPSGAAGEGSVPATMDLSGVLSVDDLSDLSTHLEIVLSSAWQRLVEPSAARLVEPATRGHSASLIADLLT